jgi:flagellar basal-body rod protein FlgC
MNINILPGIDSTSSALAAERVRMEVITQNIANANTSRGLDGKPYQRQHVVFESVLGQQIGGDAGVNASKVQLSRIESDNRPPRMVYNPGDPNADEDGMVGMPDINIHEEMADLIASSRSFEANLAVVKNARQLALETLSIGKR